MSKKKIDKNIKEIPEHHSPVRHIMAEIKGGDYHPLSNLKEARQFDDAVMIMEGDWGGQIFLSCPVKLIKCSEDNLEQLLLNLNKKAWNCNNGEGASIYYERKKTGDGIWGGMEGGLVTNDLWVHKEFRFKKKKIRQVITGERDSL